MRWHDKAGAEKEDEFEKFIALCKDEAVVCSLVWRWRGEVEIGKVEPGRGKLSPFQQNSPLKPNG